jgi:hypothetical protein
VAVLELAEISSLDSRKTAIGKYTDFTPPSRDRRSPSGIALCKTRGCGCKENQNENRAAQSLAEMGAWFLPRMKVALTSLHWLPRDESWQIKNDESA